jgi:hypothetical protein
MAPINNPKNTKGTLTPKLPSGWILVGLDALVTKAP